ncbi:unnamed protein product [Schistocephalus solidus]|uniref:Reverse transcriptase domain-containing protein n=1 Tax=Schistocephalus solidus TaxID=70667 RepID=A0A183SYA8_SCHSO|nr:unnamed protein product [Schistocephalus solidus]
MDGAGGEFVENFEKVEYLGRFFASVFTREPEHQLDYVNSAVIDAGPVLEYILFPEPLMQRDMQNLKEAKSMGPDDLPAKFLKELAGELSKPLAHIFNSLFESGKLPSEWKAVNICHKYKSGARSNVKNYRRVSLTSICCRIMESLIKKVTMKFLEEYRLLSELQHGFRQNHSCLSRSSLSTDQWTRALDEDGRVDVINTDFKKAFDSVPHKRLIYKLSEIGIRGMLLTWIADFLTRRLQTVCVDTLKSTPTPVLTGVPQGWVLGPLIFLVSINDWVDDLDCSAVMFADDVKLWRVIRSDSDRHALQEDLNRLSNWSARWLLNFNVGKCVVLRLRTRSTSEEDDSYENILNGQPLSIFEKEKDLGVLINSSLKPSSHFQESVQILVEFVLCPFGARQWGCVGADDGGKLVSPESPAEADQAIVDALWQTGQKSHHVPSNGKGKTSLASLCLSPAAPEKCEPGIFLIQLTLLGESGLAESSNI